MKNSKVFLVLLCSALFLTSCNYTRVGGHSRVGNTLSGRFDYCNGDYSKSINLEQGETVSVGIEINLEAGDMYVTVNDDSGNELFNTTTSDTFEFTADSDTKITATLHADKAGGSYQISFKK